MNGDNQNNDLDEKNLSVLGNIVQLFREDFYSTKKTKDLDDEIFKLVDEMDELP